MSKKTSRVIDEIFRQVSLFGFKPGLIKEAYVWIVEAGFNRACLPAAFVLTELAYDHQPITVRGLMYRAQAAGLFPSTSRKFYEQTARIVLKLRRADIIPYSWIVDSTRRRLKPSSWSGLSDFAEDAACSYRLDFWSRQRDYLELFVEKDAMAGVLEPVTREYDIHLNIIRGQISETFVWNVAEEWSKIEKPIFAYYLGDFDPSGLKIEARLESKLASFSAKPFTWQRLAITPDDFANPGLLGFPVKKSGPAASWRPYMEKHGDRCVEVDALDPEQLRQRVHNRIETHINAEEWEALKAIEELQRQTLREIMLSMV